MRGDDGAHQLLNVVLSGLLGFHAVESLRSARILSKAAERIMLDKEGKLREGIDPRELTASTTALRAASVMRRIAVEALDDARSQWAAERAEGGEGKLTPEPPRPDPASVDELIAQDPGSDGLTHMERQLVSRVARFAADEIAKGPKEDAPAVQPRGSVVRAESVIG